VGPLPETKGAKRLLFTGLGLAAAGLALVGCGANFNAQTQQQYQPAVGVSSRAGDVYAIDTLVVTDGKGNGTLVCALINQLPHDDTLRSVTAAGLNGSKFRITVPTNGVPLPAGQSVQLGDSGAVRVSGASLEAGSIITVTFTFGEAAPLTIQAPVVTDTSTYSKIPVGPATSARS
jgi:copper(I)-binding protein